MKGALVVFVASVLVTSACFSKAVYNKEVWQARDTGAEFDVMLHVIDDEGLPVTNARCGGWMYIEHEKERGRGYVVYTDTNGNARVTGNSSEWFSVVIGKEGYYKTSFDVKYPLENVDPPIVDGQWQLYGVTRTVVLKKIRNPIHLCDPDARYRHVYPESGKWTGFDLVCGDWVPPLGVGKCADVMIRYTREQRPDGFLSRSMFPLPIILMLARMC